MASWSAQAMVRPSGSTEQTGTSCRSNGRAVRVPCAPPWSRLHAGPQADRDVRRGQARTRLGYQDPARDPHPAGAHQRVTSAAFSPDGSRIVTGALARDAQLTDEEERRDFG